ncbi:hypothetical protein YS110_06155 [Acidovorax sp. YS12]|nr:hypothetical protein YS110_06155 [Acidovorax sp. YS12]
MSVRERVDAALVLLRRDNPRAQITVSELCRVAGVSRANIYASHKDVVESLRKEVPASPHVQPASVPTVMKKLREELAAEIRKNRALVYLLTELRAELQREYARNKH